MATTTTSNRKRKWRKAARLVVKILGGLAIVIAFSIATLIVIAYLKPNTHLLHIKNRSSNDLVVTGIRVNRMLLEQGNRTLVRETQNSLEYHFRARDRVALSMIVKSDHGTEVQLSCILKDEHRTGCIYLVALRDGPSINCICDSLADHYH